MAMKYNRSPRRALEHVVRPGAAKPQPKRKRRFTTKDAKGTKEKKIFTAKNAKDEN
jgi:hypothetical protein